MSSVSVENNYSLEHKFVTEVSFSTANSVKPKTEICGIEHSGQDDRLNQSNSGELPSVSSTISSFESADNQQNGSLGNNKGSPDSHILTNSVAENSSSKQDDGSIKKLSSGNLGAKEICRNFERYGFCRYGRNCRYFHPFPSRVRSGNSGSNSRRKDTTDNEPSQEFPSSEVTFKEDGNPILLQKEQYICKFFSWKGFCRYGQTCRFSHQIERPNSDISKDYQSVPTPLKESPTQHENTIQNVETTVSEIVNSSVIKKSNKACRLFYRDGKCRFGDLCKYRHIKRKASNSHEGIIESIKTEKGESNAEEIDESTQIKNVQEEKTENEEHSQKESVVYSTQSSEEGEGNSERKPVSLRNKKRSDMAPEDFVKLRKTEIAQLKRKFPKCKETIEPDIGTIFEVEFSPTDPDWRFDVKSVTMNVMIPENYPEENLQVDLLNPDGILPDKLVRYFNNSTFSWLQSQQEQAYTKDEVHLVFRPFLKWLDKTLEDIFIAALKMVKRDMEAEAAGIQFVTHQELNARNKSKESNVTGATSKPTESPPPTSTPEYESEMPEYDNDMSVYVEDMSSQSVLMENVVGSRAVMETARKGTEIKFRNLELLEGAASLTCSKLSITLECGRCKMRNDIATAPHRTHRVTCERCHHQQRLTFRHQLLHQFSTVAGYLDLDNCQVVDIPILTCEFALQCLPCGRQNFLSAVQYGQRQTTWCLFCHSKMIVSVESVKLNQLQPNLEPVAGQAGQPLKLEKKEKKVKDPAVQEGKPLPENGTCKHYKKSFRWLRFPCCGKAYPCDHCHDEKETDHDMKYATRMICGFCAKEQPYSADRPCTACLSNMTKKSGAHWEGGKGCRDRVKMSKDDHQKYSGMNKTIPKKLQPVSKKEK